MAVAFSIIIPCYNEEEAMPALLSTLVPLLEVRRVRPLLLLREETSAAAPPC